MLSFAKCNRAKPYLPLCKGKTAILGGLETMQKTEFIKAVADQAGNDVSQKVAKQVIEAAIQVITDTLKEGEKVTLTGFGTFEVRERKEREGVNPQTQQRMTIPATRTPGFSASSTLKEAVKQGS